MKKAVVDLTKCTDIADLHQRFKEGLGFPEYYGANLDAFWDCVKCDCEYDFVTVIGSETINEELKPTLNCFFEMLEECKQFWAQYNEYFDYEILN